MVRGMHRNQQCCVWDLCLQSRYLMETLYLLTLLSFVRVNKAGISLSPSLHALPLSPCSPLLSMLSPCSPPLSMLSPSLHALPLSPCVSCMSPVSASVHRVKRCALTTNFCFRYLVPIMLSSVTHIHTYKSTV